MTQQDTYQDRGIVLNRYGYVDVEFYHEKAKAMQAAALAELFNATGRGIAHGLRVVFEKYLCPKCTAAH